MYDERTAVIYDALYVGDEESPFRDGRTEAEHIMGIIGAHRPDARRLLDVACGTGRYLPYLSDTLAIEGLDLNGAFLEVARERCPSGTFHQADMETFELGRRFDVITCLFSSIAYVATADRLTRTVAGLRRHLAPGGLIVIEPWFTPQTFWDGHSKGHIVERPDISIAWMHRQERQGTLSALDIHYLVGTSGELTHYSEHHVLGLFTDEEYRSALRSQSLDVIHDPAFGRGLYIGISPDER